MIRSSKMLFFLLLFFFASVIYGQKTNSIEGQWIVCHMNNEFIIHIIKDKHEDDKYIMSLNKVRYGLQTLEKEFILKYVRLEENKLRFRYNDNSLHSNVTVTVIYNPDYKGCGLMFYYSNAGYFKPGSYSFRQDNKFKQ